MKVVETEIPDVKILEPKVFGEDRGYFFESYNEKLFAELIGKNRHFVQDNHSRSNKGVLRGMHYQIKRAQGKLVRVISGEVFDVAVDLRKNSPSFGKWFGCVLSDENKRQLWIPEGFAHGFLVLSPMAEFLYKTTDYYAAEYERCISWNDPELGIKWPIENAPELSMKDRDGALFRNAEVFE